MSEKMLKVVRKMLRLYLEEDLSYVAQCWSKNKHIEHAWNTPKEALHFEYKFLLQNKLFEPQMTVKEKAATAVLCLMVLNDIEDQIKILYAD